MYSIQRDIKAYHLYFRCYMCLPCHLLPSQPLRIALNPGRTLRCNAWLRTCSSQGRSHLDTILINTGIPWGYFTRDGHRYKQNGLPGGSAWVYVRADGMIAGNRWGWRWGVMMFIVKKGQGQKWECEGEDSIGWWSGCFVTVEYLKALYSPVIVSYNDLDNVSLFQAFSCAEMWPWNSAGI